MASFSHDQFCMDWHLFLFRVNVSHLNTFSFSFCLVCLTQLWARRLVKHFCLFFHSGVCFVLFLKSVPGTFLCWGELAYLSKEPLTLRKCTTLISVVSPNVNAMFGPVTILPRFYSNFVIHERLSPGKEVSMSQEWISGEGKHFPRKHFHFLLSYFGSWYVTLNILYKF